VTSPGRRPRGEQRRAALVRAAADLLLEGGFGAVSHRAVAGRAGVALAATTYYFSSLDDLLLAATEQLAAGWLEHARGELGRLPVALDDAQLARALVGTVLVGADEQVVTMYERYLRAGRHPHLRPAVTAYGAELDAVLLDVLRRARPLASADDVRPLLAVVDGTAVRALAEGDDPRLRAEAAVRAALAQPGGTA
jgi:DNA-binding transcriptional regulator YbjK